MISLTFGLIEDDPEIRPLLSRYLGFHCGLVCGSVTRAGAFSKWSYTRPMAATAVGRNHFYHADQGRPA